jgi:hypothetical protein
MRKERKWREKQPTRFAKEPFSAIGITRTPGKTYETNTHGGHPHQSRFCLAKPPRLAKGRKPPGRFRGQFNYYLLSTSPREEVADITARTNCKTSLRFLLCSRPDPPQTNRCGSEL